MGYLNQEIKEGIFDDIGASGTVDGMVEDYTPSWDCVVDAVELLNKHFEEIAKKDEWDYTESV